VKLNSKTMSRRLKVFQLRFGKRGIVGFDQKAEHARVRQQFAHYVQSLRRDLHIGLGYGSDIAAGAAETGNQTNSALIVTPPVSVNLMAFPDGLTVRPLTEKHAQGNVRFGSRADIRSADVD